MRYARALLMVAIAAALSAGCDGDDPTGPEPTAVEDFDWSGIVAQAGASQQTSFFTQCEPCNQTVAASPSELIMRRDGQRGNRKALTVSVLPAPVAEPVRNVLPTRSDAKRPRRGADH
jgi:hypothetical protein